MLKIAVLAPTPSANVTIATIANNGFFTRIRKPYRMSWSRVSIVENLVAIMTNAPVESYPLILAIWPGGRDRRTRPCRIDSQWELGEAQFSICEVAWNRPSNLCSHRYSLGSGAVTDSACTRMP